MLEPYGIFWILGLLKRLKNDIFSMMSFIFFIFCLLSFPLCCFCCNQEWQRQHSWYSPFQQSRRESKPGFAVLGDGSSPSPKGASPSRGADATAKNSKVRWFFLCNFDLLWMKRDRLNCYRKVTKSSVTLCERIHRCELFSVSTNLPSFFLFGLLSLLCCFSTTVICYFESFPLHLKAR